jgi:hypothetical protein
MHFKDYITLSGTLKIDLVYKDRVVPHLHEKNLIVMVARQTMLSMIYLDNRTSDPVKTLHIGTGGCIDPLSEFPKSVSKGLTALYNPLLSLPISYTVDNTIPQVTFIADVSEDQANGVLVNEAGLFTAGNNMFNIKTFPGVPKTSEFGIHFEWTIDLS